jgi:hypothetical protein
VSPSNRIAWAAPFEIVRMFCQHQCKTVVLKQGWPDYEFKSRQNLTFFYQKQWKILSGLVFQIQQKSVKWIKTNQILRNFEKGKIGKTK